MSLCAAAQLLAALLWMCGASQAWPQGCPLIEGATDKPTMTFGNPKGRMCRGVTPFEFNCQWLPGLRDLEETDYTLNIIIYKATRQNVRLACAKQPPCPPYSCAFNASAMEPDTYAVTVVATPGGQTSDTLRFIPNDIVRPDPPVDLRAAPRVGSQGGIVVSWKSPPTWPRSTSMFPLRIQLQYKLLQDHDVYKNVMVDQGKTRFVIEDARPGAQYRVRARAQESLMSSLWSLWSREVVSSPWRTRYAAAARHETAVSSPPAPENRAVAAPRRASPRAHPDSTLLPISAEHRVSPLSGPVGGELLQGFVSSPPALVASDRNVCFPSLNLKALYLFTIAVASALVTMVLVLYGFSLARRVRVNARGHSSSGGVPTRPAASPAAGPAGPDGPTEHPTAPHFGPEPWGEEEKASLAHGGVMNWEYWATANNLEPPVLGGAGVAASRVHPLCA